jgi:hypothetical protein
MQCIGEMPEDKMEKTELQKTHAPHGSMKHASVGASRIGSMVECNGMMQPASVKTDPGGFLYICPV